MKTENQAKSILAYIKLFGSITPSEAYFTFGCMRLSARIYDLRKKGYRISGEHEMGVNRFGRRVGYTRYRLEGMNDDEQ